MRSLKLSVILTYIHTYVYIYIYRERERDICVCIYNINTYTYMHTYSHTLRIARKERNLTEERPVSVKTTHITARRENLALSRSSSPNPSPGFQVPRSGDFRETSTTISTRAQMTGSSKERYLQYFYSTAIQTRASSERRHLSDDSAIVGRG